MILGFTGSRRGVTADQVEAIKRIIDGSEPVESAHHGDAVGADAIFHEICLTKSVPVQLHPAQIAKDRAYCQGAVRVHPPTSFKTLNQAIVHVCDLLIAASDGGREKLRSGTWAAVRFARKSGKTIKIVFPDGTVRDEPG